MSDIEIATKIKDTMAKIFEVEPTEITEDSGIKTLENWDSLRHMTLAMTLQENFGIEFSYEEVVELLNYKEIFNIVQKKAKLN